MLFGFPDVEVRDVLTGILSFGASICLKRVFQTLETYDYSIPWCSPHVPSFGGGGFGEGPVGVVGNMPAFLDRAVT